MGKLGFHFFSLFIGYYGLMIGLGVIVSSSIAYYQLKSFKLNVDDYILVSALCSLSGLIGAKILYLLVSMNEIDFSKLTDLNYINFIMRGGFVFWGSILGVLPTLYYCDKKMNIPIQPFVQSCMGCLPIAHAFGRIGCFLVGCCYGVPYNGLFSVVYTNSLFAPNGIRLFPVQLTEAIMVFCIGCVLLLLNRRLQKYSSLYLYLVGYSLVRFILEFLRYDEVRGKLFFLSTSQWISLLILIASIILFKREFGTRSLSEAK